MMSLREWLKSPFVLRLGWILIHSRLQRILGIAQPKTGHSARWLTGLVTLATCGALIAVSTQSEPRVIAQSKPEKADQPKEKSQDDARSKGIGTVISVDGEPLAGVKVAAYRQSGKKERFFITDQQGQFVTPEQWWWRPRYSGQEYVLVVDDPRLGFGCFQVNSTRDRVVIVDGVAHVTPAGPTAFKIVLQKPDRQILGRLMTPSGAAAADIPVQVTMIENAENGHVSLAAFDKDIELPFPMCRTDDSGRFQIHVPRRARTTVQIRHRDWAAANFRLKHDDADDLGDITVVPAGRIKGKLVQSETGILVNSVRVQAYRQNDKMAEGPQKQKALIETFFTDGSSGTSRNSGEFEISGLRPGEYTLTVDVSMSPADRDLVTSRSQSVSVRANETTEYELKVQHGRHISGRVLDAKTQNPVQHVNLYVRVYPDANGVDSLTSESISTDENGQFDCYTFPGFAKLQINRADQDGRKLPGSEIEVTVPKDKDPPPVEFQLGHADPNLVRPTVMRNLWTKGRVDAFTFDSTGKTIVTGGWKDSDKDQMDAWKAGVNRGLLQVWDISNGNELMRFEEEFGAIFGVALSPDDQTIYTAGRVLNSPTLGEVGIWDRVTKKSRKRLQGHPNWALSIACSPDGKRMASGGFGGITKIWETDSGDDKQTLNSQGTPRSLSFSANGRTLVAGYGTGEVKIWDVETWKERTSFIAPDRVMCSTISSDGTVLAAAGEFEGGNVKDGERSWVTVWDVSTGAKQFELRSDQMISGVALSPDGNYLAGAMFTPFIWNAKTGEQVGIIGNRGTSSSEDKIAFSPDGKILGICSMNHVTLWDVSGLKQPNE